MLNKKSVKTSDAVKVAGAEYLKKKAPMRRVVEVSNCGDMRLECGHSQAVEIYFGRPPRTVKCKECQA